ncbi:MAG: FGGY family carbohydrate kinase [Deltaproteobacteria bacterium]|nr:FGGY family carbohydrate kinase [Deltaproteobacteria bacterium]
MNILAVDIGTTGTKMGIFRNDQGTPQLVHQFSQTYDINVYNGGLFGDIEPEKWQQTFMTGCRSFGDLNAEVEVIALSGTTPGLTAMDGDGRALSPAILMLDRRSQRQAQRIIDTIGLDSGDFEASATGCCNHSSGGAELSICLNENLRAYVLEKGQVKVSGTPAEL